jgi:hypothetical protein
MGDDKEPGKEVVPARTDAQPSLSAKPPSVTITPDGKGGVNISLGSEKSAKPDEKKKMPRGSTVFRHA